MYKCGQVIQADKICTVNIQSASGIIIFHSYTYSNSFIQVTCLSRSEPWWRKILHTYSQFSTASLPTDQTTQQPELRIEPTTLELQDCNTTCCIVMPLFLNNSKHNDIWQQLDMSSDEHFPKMNICMKFRAQRSHSPCLCTLCGPSLPSPAESPSLGSVEQNKSPEEHLTNKCTNNPKPSQNSTSAGVLHLTLSELYLYL